MATRKQPSLKDALHSCYPDDVLRDLAQKAGVQRRARKVKPVALFWALVLGFGAGARRTISELRREFQQATRSVIARSAFYDRFTPQLTAFLRSVVCWATTVHGEPTESPQGLLAGFHDIVVTDSTVLRLHQMLEGAYQACRTNVVRAAAKLHLVMSVSGVSPRRVRITGERSPDGRNLMVGPWVANRLLLFDLGYFSYQLFDRIARNLGFFVSRAKANVNPRIVAVNRTCRGRSIDLVGRHLQDVLCRLQREVLDVMVEVEFKRRSYGGKQSTGTRILRLVGVLNAESGDYHLYSKRCTRAVLERQDLLWSDPEV